MAPFQQEANNNDVKTLQMTDRQTSTTLPTDVVGSEMVKPVVEEPYKLKIVWRNVMSISLLHLIAFYGAYLGVTSAKNLTVLWIFLTAVAGGFGVLTGAHRLWSHRSYKAHWSLRTLLMVFQTIALQNDIYEWCRDHRVHHKYSDTDADPHNINRGFFFAHMGWLMCKKHPEVFRKGSKIDLTDLWADPIVRFQRRFYIPLVILFWGVLPTLVPWFFWNEHIVTAFAMNMARYCFALHQTWSVNSAAHTFGWRPYDKNIHPVESASVIYLSYGEGYHNYHHTFPYDYSASEHGWMTNFNLATAFIDFFAWFGLAYDRRTASREAVTRRSERTGDKTKQWQVRNGKSWLTDAFYGVVIGTWPLWGMYGIKHLNGTLL